MRPSPVICMLVIAVAFVAGQRNPRTPCTTSNACFPWSSRGPYCGRGANMNVRFQLGLIKANYIIDPALPEPIGNVTYAFCPRVDELQAFNLTNVGGLALTYTNRSTGALEFMDEESNQIYVRIIGFGDTRNINYPQEGSLGRALIADYFSLGSGKTSLCNPGVSIAVVTFLIANVSMYNGKFQYYDGFPQPAGVGFVPTCDAYDVCLFDSSMKCIGEPGQRNCAECMTREQAREVNVQVWFSYYGTDASGRQLRSGANNPLNFQAFSGSGVTSSMRRSFNNIKEGRSNDDSGLEPE